MNYKLGVGIFDFKQDYGNVDSLQHSKMGRKVEKLQFKWFKVVTLTSCNQYEDMLDLGDI